MVLLNPRVSHHHGSLSTVINAGSQNGQRTAKIDAHCLLGRSPVLDTVKRRLKLLTQRFQLRLVELVYRLARQPAHVLFGLRKLLLELLDDLTVLGMQGALGSLAILGHGCTCQTDTQTYRQTSTK